MRMSAGTIRRPIWPIFVTRATVLTGAARPQSSGYFFDFPRDLLINQTRRQRPAALSQCLRRALTALVFRSAIFRLFVIERIVSPLAKTLEKKGGTTFAGPQIEALLQAPGI
jgi:hypothetical protein